MITVEGEQRVRLMDFSRRFQDLIKLIPNGMDWMDWAMPMSSPSFSAASEAELLENIQAGLHGTPLLSLNDLGLQFGVSRLLQFGDQDYESLKQSVSQGRVTTQAERTLRKEGFLTQKDFGLLDQKLEQAGLLNTPLLQSVSLGERIVLSDRLMRIPANEWLEGEQALRAGKFALAAAQSAPELGAALSFFYFVTKEIKPDGDARIEELWARLSRLAFRFLRCPMVPNDSSDELLGLLLRQWIGQGNLLGFPTVGDAVVNLARFSGVSLTADPVDPKPAEEYVLRAQRFLQATDPVGRSCQDGIVRWLDFQAPHASARALLDADACLSLFEFQETGRALETSGS
jgi:hypothetical protein